MKKFETTREQRESFEAKEKRLETERQRIYQKAKKEIEQGKQKTLYDEY